MPEEVKEAVSKGRLRVAQSRSGRRPMSVDTFLRKEKDGSLYKSAFSNVAELQKALEPGDIILTRAVNPSLLARIVSSVQKSQFGHAALYAGDGKVIDTRTREGVFETDLDEVHAWGGGRDIRAVRPRLPAEDRQESVRIARSYIGTPYSLTAAARLLLPPAERKNAPVQKRDAIMCAQLITHSYPTLNVAPSKERNHVMPVDIDKSNTTKLVGVLKKTAAASVLEEYLQTHPAAAEKLAGGKLEEKLPWYTAAAGGTSGALLGQKLLKKHPVAGALAGTLAGTGLGLESGTAVGKKLDKHAGIIDVLKTPIPNTRDWLIRTKPEVVPGMGRVARAAKGAVSRGVRTAAGVTSISAEELKRLGFDDMAKAGSDKAPMQQMPGNGSSRDVNGTSTQKMDEKPLIPSKIKKGDGPTREEVGKVTPTTESRPSLIQIDKVAAKGDGPTRESLGRSDPMSRDAVHHSAFTHASDQPVPGWNPTDNSKKASADEAPYVLSISELLKVAHAYREILDTFSQDKLASVDLEELHKEALLGAMAKVLPQSRKIIRMGGETIDLRPKSGLSYSGMGKKLEDLGSMFRLPKGVSRAEAAAAGNTKGVGSRIFGEGLHSAGHHMGHASAVGRTMNPLGKPVGGFIEGVARGAGQELQHAGGAVATGLKGPATTLGGGLRGQVGRGLERSAPRIGQVGEIAAAAGTATGLGHAVSPAATGLASLAKATGTYAPLKGSLGSLGFNLAKDVAATGVEGAASAAPRVASGIARAIPRVGRVAGV